MGERIQSPNTHRVSESTGVPNRRFCSSLLEFPAVHHIRHLSTVTAVTHVPRSPGFVGFLDVFAIDMDSLASGGCQPTVSC